MAEIYSNQQFMEPPIGYKFIPSDEELVLYYLIPKVAKRPLPINIIYEVELKDYNPEKLTENFKPQGENTLYIFTQRDRKYKNGERPNRIAGDGYWKASGSKYDVMHNGVKIGSKNSLVFRRGKHPNGKKTNWIMYEYTVHRPRQPRQRENQNDMRLHEWVLCTIHENHRRDRTNNDVDDESNGFEENSIMAQQLYQSTVNSYSYNSHVEHNNGMQNIYMMLYQPQRQNVIDAISYNAHMGQSIGIQCNNMMSSQPPNSYVHHVHQGNVMQDYCTMSSQPPNQNVMNPNVEADISVEDYHENLFESQEQNVMTLSVPLNKNVTNSDTFHKSGFFEGYGDFPVDQVQPNGQVSDFPEENYGVGEGSLSSIVDDWLSNLQEPPADPMDKICSSLCD